MDNREAYNFLNSRMQRMSLSDGNSRENNGQPNENESRNEGGVSIGGGRGYNGQVSMLSNMLMSYYNPFSNLSGTNGGINLAPNLDAIMNMNNRAGMVLRNFLGNPYEVMTSSTTYHDFKILLKNSYSKVDQRRILQTLIARPCDLFAIACHDHGSVVIKELIQVMKNVDCISELPKTFAPTLTYLMNHQYGRHVVEQCIKHLDYFKNQPLYNELEEQMVAIATSKYGCISIQICMDSMDCSSTFSYYAKLRLLITIAHHAQLLALDPYGIFVLQHVVPMNNVFDVSIVEKLKPLYFHLCTSKSGSYLVEKYITTCYRSEVAEELLQTNTLVTVALNEFGNYIIQKLLKETKKYNVWLYGKLCNILLKELATLECNPYSRKVANMLKAHCKNEAFGSRAGV